jgi:hypothetical protein
MKGVPGKASQVKRPRYSVSGTAFCLNTPYLGRLIWDVLSGTPYLGRIQG